MKSSEVFMKITDRKCRDAKDWIKDILFQPGTTPWDIEPTPVPEVPSWVKEHAEVTSSCRTAWASSCSKPQRPASTSPWKSSPPSSKRKCPTSSTSLEKEINEEAKEIAGKMKTKIEDQLVEGGFYNALATSSPISSFTPGLSKARPTAKLRSPSSSPTRTGRKRLQVVEEIQGQYEKVNPLDIYPAPDATGINDGYLIKKDFLQRSPAPGAPRCPHFRHRSDRQGPRAVRQNGLKEWTAIDTQRADVEHRDQMVIHDTTKIDVLVFWGEVQGKVLLQWGMTRKEVPDPFSFYHVCAWLIGNYVIKAMLNPDPLGERPYYKASFDETDGNCYWGRGLPQVIDHIQDCGQRGRPAHRQQYRLRRRPHGRDQRGPGTGSRRSRARPRMEIQQ